MDRPDAGWYPDPEQPGRARYYDGRNWTDHVRESAPSGPTAEGLPAGEPPRADAGPEAVPTRSASSGTATSTDPPATAGPAGEPARRRNPTMVVLVGIAVLALVFLASTFVSSLGTGGDEATDGALDAPDGSDAPVDGEPPSEDQDDSEEVSGDAEDPSEAEGADDGEVDEDATQEPAGSIGDADEDPGSGTDPGAETDGDDGELPFDLTLDPESDHLATIVTSEGTITVALDAAKAPLAANNLAHLAEDGYYDGVTFHRVIEDFVIQAGDPTGTGSGGPGYRFEDELVIAEQLVDEHGGYPRGTLAMANAGPNSNGSQFFIVHGELVELAPAYTVFGEVVEGMDVVDSIAATSTDNTDRPRSEITIESIEVTTE